MSDASPQPQIGPTRNPMVWIYGLEGNGRRCASCAAFDRRDRRCWEKSATLPHDGSLPACGRYREARP